MVKRETSKWWLKRLDLIVGVVIGIIFSVVVVLAVDSYRIKSYDKEKQLTTIQHAKAKIDTVKFGNYTLEIKERTEVEVSERNSIIDQKLQSYNDRISDFYVALGIIVTLMLAVIASIYFKTEAEVARYMEQNFKQIKVELDGIVKSSSESLAKIKSNEEISDSKVSGKKDGALTDNNATANDNNG